MTDNPELPALPEAAPASAEDIFALALSRALALADAPSADRITSPHALAATTLGKIFSLDTGALAQSLEASAREISGGTLTGLEGTLASQAATLNALFHRLTQFTFQEPRSTDDFTAHLKLALRAQHQSAAALAALAEIKQGPRVLVARQINAAQQQIVQNGPASGHTAAPRIVRSAKSRNPARARPRDTPQALPTPSTSQAYAPLDTRSSLQTAPRHSELEAVAPVHRSPQ